MAQGEVDAFRFIDFATRRVIQSWIGREPERDIPFKKPAVPLSESRVALISTAALVQAGDQPFDIQGEKDNPWWGDPSYRVIEGATPSSSIRSMHTHINTDWAHRDLNTLFPLDHLRHLQDSGVIGACAPRHHSFMGYQLNTDALMGKPTDDMIHLLVDDQVDLAILIPV